MATSSDESQAGTSSGKRKQKKRAPFDRAELVALITICDERGYDLLRETGSYKAKTKIMEQVQAHLLEKYGRYHSVRQLQKWFSDIKVREERFLERVRSRNRSAKAGRERAPAVEGASSSASVAAAVVVDVGDDSPPPPSPVPPGQEDLAVAPEEEMVTLVLEPVEDPHEEVQPPEVATTAVAEGLQMSIGEQLLHEMELLNRKMDILMAHFERLFHPPRS
ncbi:uncharacterized protein [Engystomops pustulosus]|uniref:uncharacterized protein n=1 Tax=Engystomops pustulosus TaxID=76066 RepID=UPI003AFA6F88